jgi:hypothetical protein
LDLYLYADVYVPGTLTENDYADVQALELPSLPQFDLVGTPLIAARSSSLVIQHSGYSPNWRGPDGSSPVLVDGLLNGWHVSPRQAFVVSYGPSDGVLASFWITGLGLVVTLGLGLSLIHWRWSMMIAFRQRIRIRSFRR